jgi:hypothetical protein
LLLTESQGPADGEQTFRDQLSVRGEIAGSPDVGLERAQIVSYRPNQIEIESETSRNRLLVLLDSYYPGWSAFVDAVPTPVIAANFVYRAIKLPQGHHRVTFRYEPKSFIYGVVISACTALIWGVVWIGGLLRRSALTSSTHAHV